MTEQQYAEGGNVHAPTARIIMPTQRDLTLPRVLLWMLGFISGMLAVAMYTVACTGIAGHQTGHYFAAGVIATVFLGLAIYLLAKLR